MSGQINLKEIEKKAWLSNFEDGIWDLYWGILLLGFGISSGLKYYGVTKPFNFLIFPLLAFVVLFFGKKYITIPRIGFVRFGEKRKKDQKILFVLGLIVFIITTTLLIILKFTSLRLLWKIEMTDLSAPIGYAFFFFIAISIIAFFMQFKRLYFYAFLFGISIPLAEIFSGIVNEPLDAIIAFSLTSLPVLIIGSILFFKFINKYEKNMPEEYYEK